MATITYDIILPDGTRQSVTETVPPEQVNRQSIQDQAQAALASNRTYLAIASPTNAQVVAQLRAITQQTQALIRLALGQFDATN